MVEQLVRHSDGALPRSRRRLHAAPRAARRPARSATRSAGRSTRPACRSSAPRRSCSCCSATSDVPAAASWRCAATRRSRARPTSRRSTTSCPATCRCRRTSATTTSLDGVHREAQVAEGVVVQHRQVHRLAAEGVLRRRGDEGERLRLRLAAAPDRRSLALRLLAGHGGRQARRALRHGTEPRRRRAERAAGAEGAGETEMARRARHGRDRDGDVLARLAGDRERRVAHRGDRDRGVLLSGRVARGEGRGRSRTRSACCSGARRRSSRPATRAASCSSCITSGGC